MNRTIAEGVNPFDTAGPVMAVTNRKGMDINGYVVGEGSFLCYSVTFRNPANQTKLFMVKVSLPVGVEFLGAGSGGAYDKDSHTVTYAVSAAGGVERTVTCDVKVKGMEAPARLAGTAVVTTDTGRSEAGPVVNEIIVEPAGDAHGADGESVSGSIVYWNQAVTYGIAYTNYTDRPRDITIVVMPDGHLKYVGDAKDGGISDQGIMKNGKILWELKDVPARYTGKVFFTARTPRPAGCVDIRNKATVTLRGRDIRFLTPEGEKGAGDMVFETNEVRFHVPEWPGHGAEPMDGKKTAGTDRRDNFSTNSVFTKKGSPFSGDTVRTVELGFAALVMAACVIKVLKKKRKRKRQRIV